MHKESIAEIGFKQSWILVLLIVVACASISAIIPPFKSPDEGDHIERAYLLGKGVIALARPEGKPSGGYVDTGLLRYEIIFFSSPRKISAEDIAIADGIRWTGERVYDPSPGTGFYFPLIYLPQALGLLTGELLDLTVDDSYRLARALALTTAAGLLLIAFRIYPPNPLALAFIVVPMMLFQLSSATIDGVSTALAVFAISAFLRIARDKRISPGWLIYALSTAVALLASSRAHMLPMLLLVLASSFHKGTRKSLWPLIACVAFVFGWTLFALKTTNDPRIQLGESSANLVSFYIQNPTRFLAVTWNTISDQSTLIFYTKSFLGVLGWLDTPFRNWQYKFLLAPILLIALLAVSPRQIREQWPQRLTLVAVALMATLTIFFALLVTWTPHPASAIAGIQGRYFLIPAILLAYGVSADTNHLTGIRRVCCASTLLGMLVFSTASTIGLLAKRYYAAESHGESRTTVQRFPGATESPTLAPSPPLDMRSPIVLKLPAVDESQFGQTMIIGVKLGTYMRTNPGEAEILLTTKRGNVYRQTFALSELHDNAYRFFRTPPDYYVSGEIRFVSGGGISVWESRWDSDRVLSCVKMTSHRNRLATVEGCP